MGINTNLPEIMPVTKNQAKKEIKGILHDAECEFEHGGGESSDGVLSNGWVDFSELTGKISGILDRIVVGDVNDKLIEQEPDWVARLLQREGDNV